MGSLFLKEALLGSFWEPFGRAGSRVKTGKSGKRLFQSSRLEIMVASLGVIRAAMEDSLFFFLKRTFENEEHSQNWLRYMVFPGRLGHGVNAEERKIQVQERKYRCLI